MAISRRIVRPDYLMIEAEAISETDWTLIGTLEKPARLIKFKNRTQGFLELSYTQENGCITLVAGEANVDDLTANSPPNADVFNEPALRSYYARWIGDAPTDTSGAVYIEYVSAETGV